MIRLENVSKIYYDTGTQVYKNFNFYVEPGGLYFITGKSGCGKTTLLRLIARDIEPDEGRILVNGRDILKLKNRQLPYYRRELGLIFQNYRLIEDKNVFNNVALSKYVAGHFGREVVSEVAYALRMVGMESKYERFPSELSGGEKQRAAIARAIVGSPKIILADEPTGNLDPANSRKIMELLVKLHDTLNITMLIVTHDIDAIRGIHGERLSLDHEERGGFDNEGKKI